MAGIKIGQLNNIKTTSDAEAVLLRFQKNKADIEFGYGAANTGSELIKNTLLLAGPVAGPVAALVWQNTMDRLIKWGQDQSEDSNQKAFAMAFNEVGDDFIKKLEQLDSKEVPKAIEDKIKELKILDSAPPEVRGTMEASFQRQALSISAVNAEEIAKQGAELKKQGNTIQEQSESIQKIDHALKQHVRDTTQRFEKIGNQVKNLKNSVEILKNQTGQNTQDISYMQGLLWNRLSVDEQLSAIQSGGFFREITPAERNIKVTQLKTQKAREELINSVSDTLNTANAFIKTAGALGIPAKTLEPLAKGVAIGETLFSATTAIISGNPVAILNSITSMAGLFGGDKPDPHEVRHKEIMDKLRGIEELQQETLEEIKKVQQQLQQVIALQAETLRQIIELSRELDSVHQSLITKLEEVNANVLESIKVTTDLGTQGIDQCRISTSTDRYNHHINNLSSASYDELLPWLAYTSAGSTTPGVALCTTWLLWTLERKAGDWFFRVRNQSNPEVPLSGRGDGLRDIYKPMWVLFQGFTHPNESALAGLISPSTTVPNLDAKWEAVREAKLSVPCHVTLNVHEKVPGVRCGDESPHHPTVADYLSYPYYLQPLGEVTQYSLDMHVFPAYYKKMEPLPINEISTPNPDGLKDGMKILNNMLRRLDIAIAQRNLLHGDLLIPDIYHQFNAVGNQLNTHGLTDEQRAEAKRKLNDINLLLDRAAFHHLNPDFRNLATNFLLYTLVKDFNAKSGNEIQYQALTQFNNLDAWKLLVSSPLELIYAATDGEERQFEIVKLDSKTQQPIPNSQKGYEMEKVVMRVPKGWSARFNQTFIRMPSTFVFKQKALIVSSDVRYLMRLRETVIDELVSYGIPGDDSLTPDQLALLNNALLIVIAH